ncbi:MAG: hypothetical protein ACLQVX_16745 [Limisphaerales bacterium]
MMKTARKTKRTPFQPEAVKPQATVTYSVRTEPVKPQAIATHPVNAEPVKPQATATHPVNGEPVKAPVPRTNRVSLELVKPGASRVFVAGSFNGWKPEQTPLFHRGNGHWVGDLAVSAGRYEYLFVVDGQWLPDPSAKESVQNPFGGKNSVLVVWE